MRAGALLLVALALAAPPGCRRAEDPERYRLAAGSPDWRGLEHAALVAELRGRYPDFFGLIEDPERGGEPDLRPLRADLEQQPADRRNYDALNAIAIGYFELNARAESRRGEESYLGRSLLTAQLIAVPWRAYGALAEDALRDAILDFFEDATGGRKSLSAGSAHRLASTIASLERKEPDPARQARIRALVHAVEQRGPRP